MAEETQSTKTKEILELEKLEATKMEHITDLIERLPSRTIWLLRSGPNKEQLIKYYTKQVIAKNLDCVWVNEHEQILSCERLEEEARNCLGKFLEDIETGAFSEIYLELENEENRLMEVIKSSAEAEEETIQTLKTSNIVEVGIHAHLKKIIDAKEEMNRALNINIDQCNHCLACYEHELEEIRLRTTGQERTNLTRHVQEVQAKMRYFLQKTTDFKDRLKPIVLEERVRREPTVPEPAGRNSIAVQLLVEMKMRQLEGVQKEIKAWLSEFKNDFLNEFVDRLLDDMFGLCGREFSHCLRLVDLDIEFRQTQIAKVAERDNVKETYTSARNEYEQTKVHLRTLASLRTDFNSHQMESCAMFVAQINRITRIAAEQGGAPASKN